MEFSVVELMKVIKALHKRVVALEATMLKIQPADVEAILKVQPADVVDPVKEEELDERSQCWGCGEYINEGHVHKCM